MKLSTGKLVYYALCLAISLALSYVEAVIPISLGVPGAKIGLPNIVTVILIYTVGVLPALLVGVMRVFLSGFLFGNLFAIIYSLSGLLLSILVEALLKKSDMFGMVGVSVAGGVFHNIGQLVMAALVTSSYVFVYAPVLIGVGVAAGIAVGLVGGILAGRLAPFLRKTIYQS